MAEAISYKALPGRSQRFFGAVRIIETLFTFGLLIVAERCRLYLGPDHLLVVRRHSLSETAHRYYFSDIQAISVRRNNASAAISAFLLIMALLLLLAAVQVGFLFALAFSPAPLLLLAIHIALGPACVTELHTPVYTERLHCLGRLHQARRFLETLRPPLELAQGRIEAGQIESAIQDRGSLQVAQRTRPRRIEKADEGIRHEHGSLHELLFYSVLVYAGSISLSLLVVLPWFMICAELVGLAALLLAALCAARQRNTDLPIEVRALCITVLLLQVILFYIAQFIGLVMGITDPGLLEGGFVTKVMENPYIMALSMANTVLFGTVGILGLAALYRFRRSYRRRMDERLPDRHPPQDAG